METQGSHATTNVTARPTVAVLIGRNHYQRMLDQPTWEKLRRFADVVEHPSDEPATKSDLLTLLPQADGCLTSWGVAQLDTDVIAAAPIFFRSAASTTGDGMNIVGGRPTASAHQRSGGPGCTRHKKVPLRKI